MMKMVSPVLGVTASCSPPASGSCPQFFLLWYFSFNREFPLRIWPIHFLCLPLIQCHVAAIRDLFSPTFCSISLFLSCSVQLITDQWRIAIISASDARQPSPKPSETPDNFFYRSWKFLFTATWSNRGHVGPMHPGPSKASYSTVTDICR